MGLNVFICKFCMLSMVKFIDSVVDQGKANMELLTNEHHTPFLSAMSRAKASIAELLASRGKHVVN